MTAFDFHRAWHVADAPERVAEVLGDLEHYPAWWPQVVAVAPIDDDTARVRCRSVLPYTLDLVLHAVRRDAERLEVAISGHLDGWASFELRVAPDGGTVVDYRQHVVVAHRILAPASSVARPVVRWNHDRMMRGCERGLQDRLATAAS